MLDDKRMLVVDDEEVVCHSCRRLFSRQGFRVETCSDAVEGLHLAIVNDYAVILLDIKMPVLDGIQFLQTLRKTKPDVPVILVTGYPSLPTRVMAARLGAAGYIAKPFTPEEITQAVHERLHGTQEGTGPASRTPHRSPGPARPADPVGSRATSRVNGGSGLTRALERICTFGRPDRFRPADRHLATAWSGVRSKHAHDDSLKPRSRSVVLRHGAAILTHPTSTDRRRFSSDSNPRAKSGLAPDDAELTQGDHAMSTRMPRRRHYLPLLALAALLVTGPTEALAQGTLYLYGASEVEPAIEEAAMTFTKRYDVRVEVTVGPPSTWLDKAKQNADLVFTTDLATMSHFIHSRELPIDQGSVAPLYVRPAVILVRPGNPKGVRDLLDLVKPGVKVMIVNGAGRAGLWKEMATTMGHGETLRALNKNTVFVPGNTTDAMELWREWADIDAWVTWNIWHMPLRHRAQVIPVSNEYSVLRQCAIALTQRGIDKTSAVQFRDFLTTPQAADIFESWAWSRPLPGWTSLGIRSHVCLACQIANDDSQGSPEKQLQGIRELVGDYKSAGVAPGDVHISAVVEGDAAYTLLKDTSYVTLTKKGRSNPSSAVVGELLESGVSVELSIETLKEKGWTKDDLLPGVKVVDSATTRIGQLEEQGYTRMKL